MPKAKVTDFTPDPHNANKGTERGTHMVETSLERYGAGWSIVVDRNGIVLAGNKTQQAAVDAGIEEAEVIESDGSKLVVVKRTDLDLLNDPKRAREYSIADNRSSEVGLAWSSDELAALVADGDIDLGAFFRDEELIELGAMEPEPKPEAPEPQFDKADDLQQKWQVATGDVWEIPSQSVPGKAHRLVCGDCVENRFKKDSVLITDPPYGISVDTSWLTALHIQRGKPANMSDDRLQNDSGNLDLTWLFEYERRLIWGFPYIMDFNATGWIVWDKQPGIDSRGIVTPIEMASTTLRKGFDMVRVMWGGYYRAVGEKRHAHPTQKPVSVIEPFLSLVKESETVFDPFLGSGTTMVAAERTGRVCYGVEIEPKYCAVILQRMSDMGLEPRKVTDGTR